MHKTTTVSTHAIFLSQKEFSWTKLLKLFLEPLTFPFQAYYPLYCPCRLENTIENTIHQYSTRPDPTQHAPTQTNAT
jgi:hypothetical protein